MAKSDLSIPQQIDILLKRQRWNPPSSSIEVVPDYLQQAYARESVAGWLGDISVPPVPVIAALIRGAMTDEEENVRERALKSLLGFAERDTISKTIGAAILWAATSDPSSRIRCTALEGIWALDDSLGKECAKRLCDDVDWVVAETARNIVKAE
jgi:hypothetical protein